MRRPSFYIAYEVSRGRAGRRMEHARQKVGRDMTQTILKSKIRYIWVGKDVCGRELYRLLKRPVNMARLTPSFLEYTKDFEVVLPLIYYILFWIFEQYQDLLWGKDSTRSICATSREAIFIYFDGRSLSNEVKRSNCKSFSFYKSFLNI
jgi:hypothetical protein